MKKQSIHPTGIAQAFALNETFFSTTDERGVITSGNKVFSRTSGYALDELIGTAHNIVRHPDMPRCVFKMLWDCGQEGQPFMGYVKNLAKNGNHYWVFALIVSIPSGFLSVRIKPTTQVLDTIEVLYQRLVACENTALSDGRTLPEAMALSQEMLDREVETLGYESYQSFSRYSLNAEIKQRDEGLAANDLRLFPEELVVGQGGKANHLKAIYNQTFDTYDRLGSLLENLDTFSLIYDDIQGRQFTVQKVAEEFRLNALNANIASEPLGQLGVTIGTVTQFLHEYSTNLSQKVDALADNISITTVSIADIAAYLATARLQLEMLLSFLAEIVSSSTSPKEADRLLVMAKDLRTAFSDTLERATSAIRQVQRRLPELKDNKEEIRKLIVYLNVAQISGHTESMRIDEVDHLRSMFNDLRDRIDSAKGELEHLENIVNQLTQITEQSAKKLAYVSEFLSQEIAV